MEDIEALNSATVKMAHVYRALTFITKLNVRYSLENESDQKVSYWRVTFYINKKYAVIVELLNYFVMVNNEKSITKEIMKNFVDYIFYNWERLEDD